MESESRRPGNEATANDSHDGRDYVSPNSPAMQAGALDTAKQFECIPVEMRNYRQFVCWLYEHREGNKPTKVPYKAIGHGKASVSNPEHWTGFDEAVAAFKAGGFDGIGFVFTDNDPFTGIDLDDARDDAEAFAVQQRIYQAFDSYAELSPSGHGLHIIVKGKVASRRRGKVEVYSSGRYFTMTGRFVRPGPINDCQGLLEHLSAELGSLASETPPQPSQPPSRPDSEVLASLMADPALAALWNGKWEGLYKSQSDADQALCNALAPRTNFNPAEVERIWLGSPLGQREKTQSRPDYRERTINKAMDSRPNFALQDFSKLTAEIAAKVQGTPARQTAYTAEELWDADFAPIAWIVPTLVAAGLTLLVGAPKLGKSWLALDLANAVAHGGFALNMHCPQGSVLYAALEDTPRRIKDRLQRICTVKPGPALTIWTEMPTLDKGGVDALRNWITSAVNPRLIVVDVLNMVRPSKGKGEDAYVYDYRSVQSLKALADEFGIGVVVVHHTRKAEADDKLERTSGTNGLTGAADTTLVLSRDSNGPVLAGRGRDVEEFELALDFDRDTCRWENLGAPSDVRRSDERAAILSAVARANAPLTPQEIANVTGQSPGNVRRLLGKMVDAGELRKEGRGKYAHPYTPGNNGNKVTNEGGLFS